MTDLYKALGVPWTAGDAEIKQAYRRLAKACHPDLHGGERWAELRFKEIGSAYATLGDPDARAAYDQLRSAQRARRRRRFAGLAATMAASFVITVASGLILGAWLIAEAGL